MNAQDASVLELIGPPANPKWAARRLARNVIRDGFTAEALHTYTDANGTPIYWRVRARQANGEKWIRPMRREGIDYALGEPAFNDGKKPLYRLHELTKRPGVPVWYVEGEACVEALKGAAFSPRPREGRQATSQQTLCHWQRAQWSSGPTTISQESITPNASRRCWWNSDATSK